LCQEYGNDASFVSFDRLPSFIGILGLLDDPSVMGDLSESEELGTSTKDDAITEILEQDW
jgi:hypothetical protein